MGQRTGRLVFLVASMFLGTMASQANAEVFAIHCAEPTGSWRDYDFTIDTDASTVSFRWAADTVAPHAQITSQSIDWTYNDPSPPVPGWESYHIDRTSGVMQTDWSFPGAAHPSGSVTYHCQKTQGF